MPGKQPSRRLGDWLEGFLQYMENSESARAYQTWAAIATVSAVLQRRVWMQWGHTQIFPNQYIALIGPSGNRKAEPLLASRDIVAVLGLPIVPEEITRQALYREIREAASVYIDPATRAMIPHSSIYGVFEELAVFLGEGDGKFLASLTNWYDSRDAWAYKTKHEGADKIQGVCFTMLGSMAPDWIPMCIPRTAVGGGFTSRVIFIVETNKRKTITNPNESRPDAKLREDLIHDLEVIKTLTGEYTFTPGALRLYEDWYAIEDRKAREGNPPIKDPRFSGYVSRRQTHVKKIAMSVAASRSDSRVITEPDFERSRLLLEQAEVNMQGVFGRLGSSSTASQVVDVIEYLQARKMATRSELLSTFFRDLSLKDLYEVEATLEAMRVVKVDRKQGKEPTYEWVGARL